MGKFVALVGNRGKTFIEVCGADIELAVNIVIVRWRNRGGSGQTPLTALSRITHRGRAKRMNAIVIT